jgi:ABC-type nitrate/sulfonate/bicarbonate transport system substrate-binding protein
LFADDLGYFEEEGIEVDTIVGEDVSATLIAGMIGGQYDILLAGADAILAAAAGGDVIAIAAQSSAPVWSVVARPGISSIEELQGKRIAVAGPDSIATAAMKLAFEAWGLPVGSYETLSAGGTGTRVASAIAGQTDAALAYSPAEFAIEKQGLKSLGTLAEKLPDFIGGVASTRKSWAETHKDTVVRFLRAYLRGTRYYHDPANKEAVIRRGAELPNFDEDVMRRAYAYWFEKPVDGKTIAQKVVPIDLRISRTGLQTTADAFFNIGALTEKFDTTAFYDEQYIDAALKGM